MRFLTVVSGRWKWKDNLVIGLQKEWFFMRKIKGLFWVGVRKNNFIYQKKGVLKKNFLLRNFSLPIFLYNSHIPSYSFHFYFLILPRKHVLTKVTPPVMEACAYHSTWTATVWRIVKMVLMKLSIVVRFRILGFLFPTIL